MFEKDLKRIEQGLIRWVNEWLVILQQDINSKTPEDTKTLLQGNKVVSATNQWWVIVGQVRNDTEYAAFVEFWVMGKRYQYRKPKWNIFYIWVGARMFTRAANDTQNAIRNTIARYI